MCHGFVVSHASEGTRRPGRYRQPGETRYYSDVNRLLTTICGGRRPTKPRRWYLLALVLQASAATVLAQTSAPPRSISFFPTRQLWTIPLSSPPAALRSASDNRYLFVPLSTGSLTAVALDSATAAWTARLQLRGPVDANGTRVIVVAEGAVQALDPASGSTLWTVPDGDGGAVVAAQVLDSQVVVLTDTGTLRAHAVSDGTTQWTRALGPERSALLLSASDVYVGSTDGRVMAVRAQDGTPRWTTQVDGQPGAMAVNRDRLYFGTSDKAFYSLRVGDGRIDWRWRVGASVVGAPAFDDRHVYFAALDNQLRALDSGSGAQRWRKPLTGRPIGSPVVVGSSVVVPCLAAEIRGFSTRDGGNQGRYPTDAEVSSSFQVIRRPNRMGGDVMLLILSDGSVVAVQRRIEPPLLPLTDLPGVTVPIAPAPPTATAK